LVGTWVLGASEKEFAFEASWQWVVDSLSTIGPAFLVGCGVMAVVGAIVGYFGIQVLWRHSVNKEWKKRQHRSQPNDDK